MSHKHTWEEAQFEELAFWNSPGAELGEQLKQLAYIKYLGLDFTHDGNSPYVINKSGLRILDVGGGPVSLLLKTIADKKVVVDPCDYPQWVDERYQDQNTELRVESGEDFLLTDEFDEVWMYNVLQHTTDPRKIFKNIHTVLKKGGVFRFLDWIDTPTNVAHPVSLSFLEVFDMIRDAGFEDPKVSWKDINENKAIGKIVYGTFKK